MARMIVADVKTERNSPSALLKNNDRYVRRIREARGKTSFLHEFFYFHSSLPGWHSICLVIESGGILIQKTGRRYNRDFLNKMGRF